MISVANGLCSVKIRLACSKVMLINYANLITDSKTF